MAKAKDRPARLVLIRHGESMRNEAKRGKIYFADDASREALKGIPDHKIHLTEEGLRQARETGVYLRDTFPAPDFLYDSGYARTSQTAEGILEAYSPKERDKIERRSNELIRERDHGYTYEMTEEEVRRWFPWYSGHRATFGSFFTRPPGGDSIADVANRVSLFLDMLFQYRGKMNVFVVTHGGTMKAFRYLLEHQEKEEPYDWASKWPEGEKPENCGITVYEFNRRAKRLVLQVQNHVAWEPLSPTKARPA